ncbi:hypothetical protein [Myxococcus xanthus]|uniref:hypothetical protein n=1 Tax=Myxococcus xanthus TaxID=34 RepID=UPI001F2AB442|nr:hypothetical protein [Myxococcus xanthus]
MRRFSRGLTALLAAAGLSSAQASDDVFGYAVPSEDLPVAVKVDYVVTGCWVFTQSTFYLKVTRSGAEVSGRGDDWEDPVKLSPKKLSRAEGERILRDLTSAMLRRESESASGHAPTHYETTVEWACGGVRGRSAARWRSWHPPTTCISRMRERETPTRAPLASVTLW